MDELIHWSFIVLLACMNAYSYNPSRANPLAIALIILLSSLYFFLYQSYGRKFEKLLAFINPLVFLFLSLGNSLFAGIISAIAPIYFTWNKKEGLIYLIPLFLHLQIQGASIFYSIFLLIISLYSFYLSNQYKKHSFLKEQYYRKIDEKESLIKGLRKKYYQLSLELDLNRKNDVLMERNRIAREIHDNLGHKLTSLILQITALQVIHKELNKPLEQIVTVLKEAMEDIRSSIHSIHEQSLSLKAAIEQVEEEFSFCPIYSSIVLAHEPGGRIHYAILLILKESLANTAKHSNATRVDISLKETESLYQLLIKDNGKNNTGPKAKEGIGLMSIEERVYSLGGSFHLSMENGYHIFIQLPKEDKESRREDTNCR